MNTPKPSPHAILQRFADDLALLPLQPRTQKSYWACVRQLSEHFDKSPDLVSAEELRQYFIDLKVRYVKKLCVRVQKARAFAEGKLVHAATFFSSPSTKTTPSITLARSSDPLSLRQPF